MASPKVTDAQQKVSVPTGLWKLCDGCSASLMADEVERALFTCPKCGHHFRIGGRRRLRSFLDSDSMTEVEAGLRSGDPLEFKDTKRYKDRIKSAEKDSGESEAFVLTRGRLHGRPLVAGAFEFGFMGGSMGSVVGEKVTRAFEVATERNVPVVIFSASGGARMQEGILSLMQMAKTSAAISRFRTTGQPYISVLTDPTTGGVAASFSLLGDIIIAEPNALVGFAGPRVIEQTIRQTLPEGFQRSEFLLEHGVIDMIVPRHGLRERIAQIIDMVSRAA